VACRKEAPDSRQEKPGRNGDKAKEENDDNGMLLIHQIVAQAGTAAGDAATGELHIEFAKPRRDVVHKQSMEEPNGGVSAGSVRG